MRKITRWVDKYEEYTGSWFKDPVVEYEFVTELYQWLARKLPKRFVLMCYIQVIAFATTHGEGTKITPDEMTFSKAVKIWESYQ